MTSNFHVYRSLRLAKQQGFLDPVGISADSGVYFLPNNVLRECFGIVKDRLYGKPEIFLKIFKIGETGRQLSACM